MPSLSPPGLPEPPGPLSPLGPLEPPCLLLPCINLNSTLMDRGTNTQYAGNILLRPIPLPSCIYNTHIPHYVIEHAVREPCTGTIWSLSWRVSTWQDDIFSRGIINWSGIHINLVPVSPVEVGGCCGTTPLRVERRGRLWYAIAYTWTICVRSGTGERYPIMYWYTLASFYHENIYACRLLYTTL